jgi:hypothetical protein
MNGGKGAAPKGKGNGQKGLLGKLKNAANGALKKNNGSDSPGAGAGAGAAPPPASGSDQGEKVDAKIAREQALANLRDTLEKQPSVIQKILIKIWEGIKAIGRFCFHRDSVPGHYITLAIVLFLLIFGIVYASNRRQRSRKSKKERSTLDKLLGHTISGYFAPAPATTGRPTIGGRCDNVEFVEQSSGGVCVNNNLPAPIRWIIDSDKIPELKELPQNIKDKISNDGKKFIVTIPWKPDGLNYMPDCDQAMFSDGTPAYLLVDGGGICKKLEMDKVLQTSAYRYLQDYSKFERLDKFLENPDPNSSVVEKVSAGEVCSIATAKELGIFDNTRFYKPGYDTLRSYNKDIDRNGAFAHKLCTESTVNDQATVMCPLMQNAGIGFTNKPGSKCVTAECPTGFTEDATDPLTCKKPIKEKVVQIGSRNDEQYDDWYTIPNYHLGNKYASSNATHYAPCLGSGIPYYATDPVDEYTSDYEPIDKIGLCVDKSVYFAGKYADTAHYCPVSMIKRVGSTREDLYDYYTRMSGKAEVPQSVKNKIETLLQDVKKGDNYANLGLLTDEMEMACDKLNQDSKKLEEAYMICELLAKNEEGFVAKFGDEPDGLRKLRVDAAKYSCQQLFGLAPEDRSNPLAYNDNAFSIEKPTLNFPDAENIQFEQYLKEYEQQNKSKDDPLPVITAEHNEKRLFTVFVNYVLYIVNIIVIIVIIIAVYHYRREIGKVGCEIWHSIIWVINKFKKVPILLDDCKTFKQIKDEKEAEKRGELEAQKLDKELEEAGNPDKKEAAAAPEGEKPPPADKGKGTEAAKAEKVATAPKKGTTASTWSIIPPFGDIRRS